jgi:hypothetical protein
MTPGEPTAALFAAGRQYLAAVTVVGPHARSHGLLNGDVLLAEPERLIRWLALSTGDTGDSQDANSIISQLLQFGILYWRLKWGGNFAKFLLVNVSEENYGNLGPGNRVARRVGRYARRRGSASDPVRPPRYRAVHLRGFR